MRMWPAVPPPRSPSGPNPGTGGSEMTATKLPFAARGKLTAKRSRDH